MYLSSINTYEKAYILGLIVFNIKEDCSDKIIVEINFKKEKINNCEYYKNIDKIIEKAAADSATKGAETNKKDQNFKGPEGFSNVIGVGPNPVMEAMNLQLEEAQKQTALLEKIASPEGGVPKDFTKDSK